MKPMTDINRIRAMMTDEERFLVSNARDISSRAADGVFAATGFLSPRERTILMSFGIGIEPAPVIADDASDAKIGFPLARLAARDEIGFFWGGYPEAERTLYCALPAYALYSLDAVQSGDDTAVVTLSELAALAKDELSELIVPLFVKTSGYVSLTHRDFMGALLGLGIERSVLGDIVLTDNGAIVFAHRKIADFIRADLSEVGRDHVKVSALDYNDVSVPPRAFETLTGTVASARLDAVVSEIANCSRETAKEMIRRGLVEQDHFPASDTDSPVSAGDVISIRHEGRVKGGKFIIDSCSELTQKGRVRLSVRKYM